MYEIDCFEVMPVFRKSLQQRTEMRDFLFYNWKGNMLLFKEGLGGILEGKRDTP
jgi:hypothetical protein